MGKAVIVYVFPEPEDDMELGYLIEKAQQVFPKGEDRKIYMGVNAIAEMVFDIFNPGETLPESNLVSHARRELELVGEDPEYIEGIVDVVQAFADMGHSGSSAAHFTGVLNELLQFNNLTPLTDDPEEWLDHTGDVTGGENLWQSRRNPKAFSTNGGRTYYMIDDLEKIQHETKRIYK